MAAVTKKSATKARKAPAKMPVKGKAAKPAAKPKANPRAQKAEAKRKAADRAKQEQARKAPTKREGVDQDTSQARTRQAAPLTPAERAEEAAGEAQEQATDDARFNGRVKDTADGPSEAIEPRTSFPHPYSGTDVDQVGGVSELAHRAGVYGMDSRDYQTRLEALAEAVGAGKDDSMDPRDRNTRLVALHDRLIDAARKGNTVDDVGDLVTKSGLNTGGRRGGGQAIEDVKDVLAQVGLLPGNL